MFLVIEGSKCLALHEGMSNEQGVTMSVSAFNRYKLHDMPEALRMVAAQIEHGDIDAVRCVLVLESLEGAVTYKAFGAEPFTNAHAIGLCFCAAKEIAP